MKRVFLDKHDSSGTFQNGRVKLDAYFHSSDGEKYVWTPDWKEATRHFLKEACDVGKLAKAEVARGEQIKITEMKVTIKKEEPKIEHIDFEPIAFRLGELLKRRIAWEETNQKAASLFDFKPVIHSNPKITNINSQTIYDWVLTLGEQPIDSEKKLELLKSFVRIISPKDTPLARV